MKLNYDCIRDILLTIEETDIEETITFNKLKTTLGYSENDIWYSCHLLFENGYIAAVRYDDMDNLPLPYYPYIKELTLKGHKLLNSIRNESIWANKQLLQIDKNIYKSIKI